MKYKISGVRRNILVSLCFFALIFFIISLFSSGIVIGKGVLAEDLQYFEDKDNITSSESYEFDEEDFTIVGGATPSIITKEEDGVGITNNLDGISYVVKEDRPSGAFTATFRPLSIDAAGGVIGIGLRQGADTGFWHNMGQRESLFLKFLYPSGDKTRPQIQIFKSGATMIGDSIGGANWVSPFKVVEITTKKAGAVDASGEIRLVVDESGIYANGLCLYSFAEHADEWANVLSMTKNVEINFENTGRAQQVGAVIKQVNGTNWVGPSQAAEDKFTYVAEKDEVSSQGSFTYDEDQFSVVTKDNRTITVEEDGVAIVGSGFGYEIKSPERPQGAFTATFRPKSIDPAGGVIGLGLVNTTANFWHGTGNPDWEAIYLKFRHSTGDVKSVSVEVWKSGKTVIGDIQGTLYPFASVTVPVYQQGHYGDAEYLDEKGEIRLVIDDAGVFVNGIVIYAPQEAAKADWANYIAGLNRFDYSVENPGKTEVVGAVIKQICGTNWTDAKLPESPYHKDKDYSAEAESVYEFSKSNFRFPIDNTEAEFVQMPNDGGVAVAANDLGLEMVNMSERTSKGVSFSATVAPYDIHPNGWFGLALRANYAGSFWHMDTDTLSFRFMYPTQKKSEVSVIFTYKSTSVEGFPTAVDVERVSTSLITYSAGGYGDPSKIDESGELRIVIDETGVYINGVIIYDFEKCSYKDGIPQLFENLHYVDVNVENRGRQEFVGAIVKNIDGVKWQNEEPERETLAPLPRITPSENTSDSITIALPNYFTEDGDRIYGENYSYVIKVYDQYDYNGNNIPMRVVTVKDWLQSKFVADNLEPSSKYFFVIEVMYKDKLAIDYFPLMERTLGEISSLDTAAGTIRIPVGSTLQDIVDSLQVRAVYKDGTKGELLHYGDIGLSVSGYVYGKKGEQKITLAYRGVSCTVDILFENRIDSIRLDGVKENYLTTDTAFALDEGNLIVLYADASENAELPLSSAGIHFSAFDATAGTHTAEITYASGDQTLRIAFEYTVADAVNAVEYKVEGTFPKSVELGKDIDLSGVYLQKYVNGAKEGDPIAATQEMIFGYDADGCSVGKTQVALVYGGVCRAEYEIEVLDSVLFTEFIEHPQYFYYVNAADSVNATDSVLRVAMRSGKVEDIALDGSEITFDASQVNFAQAGQYPVTVNYGKGTMTFYVYIGEDFVTGISITPPTKLNYVIGDSLDLTGGSVEVLYKSGQKETIPMTDPRITVSGFSSTTPNPARTVKVSLTDSNIEYTAEFKVRISAEVGIESIAVAKNPNKTAYEKGEALDLTGGQIKVVYGDGSEIVLDMTDDRIAVKGFDPEKEGKQTITLTFENLSCTFEVEVTAPAGCSGALQTTGAVLGLAVISLLVGICLIRRKSAD